MFFSSQGLLPFADCPRVKVVSGFDELVSTRFSGGVNALCWPRALGGDFAEVATRCGADELITTLSEAQLRAFDLSPAGRAAVDVMLEDLRRLRERGLAPELNCIHSYPRDDDPLVVPTDVYSFHADSAPVEADTWLCTYHGAASEGLLNEEARRKTDVPETRAELLKIYDGPDDAGFRDFLRENCFDLHYATLPHARPYAFGVGNLWRIATDHPASPVPPCIHRAPAQRPGQTPRLLLIS